MLYSNVVSRLKCQNSGFTLMLTHQPRDDIFEYCTHWCELFV